jgi:hypothetical protein
VLLAGGSAVAARSAAGAATALAVLLASAAGLSAFFGTAWAAWPGLGAAALVGMALVRARVRRVEPAARDSHRSQPALLEISREPLLACAAGGLLATGLVAACHTAVVAELPRTLEIESNALPPSQRHRAFPRLSVIEQVTGGEPAFHHQHVAAMPTDRANQNRRGDLSLFDHLLLTGILLFSAGVVGLLARRRSWAIAIAAVVAVQAVVLLLSAFAVFPVQSTRPEVPLLAPLAATVGIGLLSGIAFLLAFGGNTGRSVSSGRHSESGLPARPRSVSLVTDIPQKPAE